MSLLCKNCGAVSPKGSKSCQSCSITGHFQPFETNVAEAQKSQNAPTDPTLAGCRNCGTAIDRSLTTCPVCLFRKPDQAAKNGLLKLAQFSLRN